MQYERLYDDKLFLEIIPIYNTPKIAACVFYQLKSIVFMHIRLSIIRFFFT